MTDKHTPGKWWIEEEDGTLSIIGPREKSRRFGVSPAWELARIENSEFWDDPKTEAEDRENARLIAQAWTIPQLRAALEQSIRDRQILLAQIEFLEELAEETLEEEDAAMVGLIKKQMEQDHATLALANEPADGGGE